MKKKSGKKLKFDKEKIVQEPLKIIKKISSFSLNETFDNFKDKIKKAEIERAKSQKKEKIKEAKRKKLELKRQKIEEAKEIKKEYLQKIKYLDKSEYVLRPDFINSLRLFN